MTAAERTRAWKAKQRAERVLTDHLCECGCGERTYAAIVTDRKRGHVRGEPLRFLAGHGHHIDKMTPGEKHEAKRRWDAADHARHREERNARSRRVGAERTRNGKNKQARERRTPEQRAAEQTRKNAWARRTGRSRRAARENATAEDAAFTFVLIADPCAYCGAPSEHVDHIEPRCTGGADVSENWTGACSSCNCSKRHTPLLLYLLRRHG